MTSRDSTFEPNERAQEILRILVENYIREGAPVGSRTLSKSTGLALSPATIRNVMSDLEDLGFVASPHTSAGRVPTSKGYRFFVDTLLRMTPPSSRDLQHLERQIGEELSSGQASIAETASSALSALTSLAGVVTIPKQTHYKLRQVEFLALSDRRVLAILVVNDSEVENRVLQMDRDYTNEELVRAANFLNEHFAGQDVSRVRELVVEKLQDTRETMNQLMIDVVNIAQQALADEPDRSQFVLSGQTKLMEFEELSNVTTLKQLFEAFNQQREILRLLDRSIAADGVQIFIGEESGFEILDDCSVVTAPYRVDDDTVGVLGVIGPTRMAYERVIPIVDITAKLVGSALNSE